MAAEPLEAGLAALADRRDAAGTTPLHATSLTENRERIRAGHRLCSGGPELLSVTDSHRVRSDGQPEARVYVPHAPSRGTLVYLHGGGWITGDLDYGDEFCRHLAAGTGLTVHSVSYRLAPEHPFPTPLEDAWASFVEIHERHSEGPFVLVGDSAGGNLASACLLRARDRGLSVDLHVLVYPVTGVDLDTASYREHATSFPLGRDDMRACFEAYLGGLPESPSEIPDEVATARRDLSGLPPGHVVTAEHDPLRDDGHSWTSALKEAGVPVSVAHHPDLCHGFLRFTGASGGAANARDELVATVAALVALP